jgi:hypothetical protein
MNAPPGSPTGSLWRELPVSRAFFYISLEPSFVCLTKSSVNDPPPPSSERGPYGERCLFPEPSCTSGSPIKKHLLPIPLTELRQRQMPRFQTPPSFVTQECPINETPSRFSNGAPIERVARFPSLLLRVSWIPQ